MTHVHINWRLASRLSVITMAVLVVLIITLVQLQHGSGGISRADSSSQSQNSSNASNANDASSSQVDLGGTIAPNFTLTDQNGQRISLNQFKGKPVVLTFLYTHCPDVCPLTAEHIHTTMLQLGSQAKDVAVLAVSMDPIGDTPAAVQSFSKAHSMTNYWHYLIGSQQQLSPVWSSYDIYQQASKQSINHSMAIFVIDQQGKERTYFDNTFTPTQLTANLHKLLSA